MRSEIRTWLIPALAPESLVKGFCDPPGEGIERRLAASLFRALEVGGSGRSHMMLSEWRELFRLAHDDESKRRAIAARRAALAEKLGVAIETVEREHLALYAIQTAYAILVKAIAFEVASSLRLERSRIDFGHLAAADSAGLRARMASLEEGAVFRDLGIGNLLEGDLFSWYCAADRWTPDIAGAVREVFRALAACEPGTGSGAGSGARDLFKDLYQRIVPAEVRHCLGEFYTPPWLAELVVDRAIRRCGAADWRGFDPCAGSGAFVAVMIRRVLDELADRPAGEQLRAVLRRVQAIDLNPLAVLTARVNYLAHVAHLVGAGDRFEIPVFLGDASRGAERGAGLGRFDVVVGNPPWIDWKNLPAGYRERVKRLGVARHLFSGDSITGGINLNICALIANAAAQSWLADAGVLGFLMPETILFQQTYRGFRDFALDGGGRLYLQEAADLSGAGHPFAPVTQPFHALFWSRREVDYRAGVPFARIRKRRGVRLADLERAGSFAEVAHAFEIEEALAGRVAPEGTAFAIARDRAGLERLARVSGRCAYRGREGIEFYPQELFLLAVDGSLDAPEGCVFVRNFQNPKSKYRVPEQTVVLERTFLRPLVKGIDIERFRVRAGGWVVPFPYEADTPRSPLPLAEVGRRSPQLARFLSRHKALIEAQTDYNRRIIGEKHATEFYALARVGAYTFGDWFVAFRDNTRWGAAVVSTLAMPWGERRAPVFQNHAVSIAQDAAGRFIGEDEAHYVCAALNAPIVAALLASSADSRSFPIRPPVRLPPYDPAAPAHRALSELSKRAHRAADDAAAIAGIDAEIDRVYLGMCGERRG
jgi:methylase of polypeptide subunit release factors